MYDADKDAYIIVDDRWEDEEAVLEVKVGRYIDTGAMALLLVEEEDGSPYARLTVNVPLLLLPEQYVWIKDYSENEGLAGMLVEAKVLEPMPDYQARAGFATVEGYKLTDTFYEWAKKNMPFQS